MLDIVSKVALCSLHVIIYLFKRLRFSDFVVLYFKSIFIFTPKPYVLLQILHNYFIIRLNSPVISFAMESLRNVCYKCIG